MPFKLRLKKSRQYNVVSKNVFVISVELLDKAVVECTLSAESSGQECLDNVCQRICLQQSEFFGLRFLSKRYGLRWVDMEKPLKRQLEKYASDSSSLYLAVMFYVGDVVQLFDEVTRYQYFLQLKNDVIEGHLPCSSDEAVLLAAHSLQAEFGSHDPGRHTVEYLKDFPLLPKQLGSNTMNLLSRVISAHAGLVGLLPSAAEIHYIQRAQQLEGYGLEYIAVKDESGQEIWLGVSAFGVVVKYPSVQKSQTFNWNDILNLSNHKRFLVIECETPRSTFSQFQMEDSDAAKYVWKLCILQHKFYMKTKSIVRVIDSANGTDMNWRSISMPYVAFKGCRSTLKFEIRIMFERVAHPKGKLSGGPVLDWSGEGRNLQTYVNQNPLFDAINSNPLLYSSESQFPETLAVSSGAISEVPYEEEMAAASSYHQHLSSTYSVGNMIHGNSGFSLDSVGTPTYSAQEAAVGAQQQGSNVSLHQQQQQQTTTDQLRALLPSYRPAPDYEMAVQLKYGAPSSVSSSSVPEGLATTNASQVYGNIGGSGVAVHHDHHQLSTEITKSYSHYKNFFDLAHLDEEGFSSSDVYGDDETIQTNRLQQQQVHCRPAASTWVSSGVAGVHTYSTPELTSQGLIQDLTYEQLIQNFHLLNQFKPPPPYPYSQRSSSSTPDLASRCPTAGVAVAASHTAARQHRSSDNGKDLLGFAGAKDECVAVVDPRLPLRRGNNNNNLAALPEIMMTRLSTDPTLVTASFNSRHIANGGGSSSLLSSSIGMLRSRSSSTQSAPEPVVRTGSDATGIDGVPRESQSATVESAPTRKMRISKGVAGCDSRSRPSLGPLFVAAMNGLSVSNRELNDSESANDLLRGSKDCRCHSFENKLTEGSVFMEFENILKKRQNADYTTALLPENNTRNRFKDVLPYEDNRVLLSSSKDNKTGYVNASHVTVTAGQQQRHYIASQGPLANTTAAFWQMVWEQNAHIIVMLTEVKEQGKDKCFPYWPQDDSVGAKVEFGNYQIVRKFRNNSTSFVTSALTFTNLVLKKQRNVWHIQYTDWPDHGCPEDVQGFLCFMDEIDSVRRHAAGEVPPGKSRNLPMIVHCSAGVGRSGVTMLCDIMIYSLDHNENLEVPKVLTDLRQQRMLTVQTLAQYKFVYKVLIQYLKNSRLI